MHERGLQFRDLPRTHRHRPRSARQAPTQKVDTRHLESEVQLIIVKLIGGLGNQMFQYAFGRNLSGRLGVQLKLDISGFETYRLRRYSLGALNIVEAFASNHEIAMSPHVSEVGFAFDPRALLLPDGCHLDGYWQSEKYFAGCDEILREEFSVRTALKGPSVELAQRMRSQTSVSLHVRRGDYVANPHTAAVHHVCDAEYYERCIDYMGGKLENPEFFVFSDEPEWARENLRIPYPTTVVSHNDVLSDYDDLRLMGMCDHHIIANSSFSWWGAWLNPSSEKIVIAPRLWFGPSGPQDTQDVVPSNWVRM